MRQSGLPSDDILSGIIEPRLKSGLKLKGTDLWLDPKRKKPFAFVSHAHSDHMVVSHNKAVVSLKTARFYQEKFKGKELIGLNYGERKKIGNTEIELLPAGHILGSSQILFYLKSGTVVYTGDMKVRRSYTAERIRIKPCDVLIMECTFGSPQFIFPEKDEAVEELKKFILDCFAKRYTPVVVAYRIGKAQEVVKALGDMGFKLRLERSIYEVTEIYRELGINLINYRRYPPFTPNKEVIVIPPGRLSLIKHIPRRKIALVTGWSLDKKMISRFYHDIAIPLSDHADFAELLTYVIMAKPKKVYTVHGTAEFSKYLRSQGIDAVHLDVPYLQPTLWGYV